MTLRRVSAGCMHVDNKRDCMPLRHCVRRMQCPATQVADLEDRLQRAVAANRGVRATEDTMQKVHTLHHHLALPSIGTAARRPCCCSRISVLLPAYCVRVESHRHQRVLRQPRQTELEEPRHLFASSIVCARACRPLSGLRRTSERLKINCEQNGVNCTTCSKNCSTATR